MGSYLPFEELLSVASAALHEHDLFVCLACLACFVACLLALLCLLACLLACLRACLGCRPPPLYMKLIGYKHFQHLKTCERI